METPPVISTRPLILSAAIPAVCRRPAAPAPRAACPVAVLSLLLALLALAASPGLSGVPSLFGVSNLFGSPGFPGVTLDAQDAGTDSVQEQPSSDATPPPPSMFQLPDRTRAVADSAAQAEQAVQRLGSVERLSGDIDEAEARYDELAALLESMVETEVVRLERLSRLRDQALLEDSRLEDIDQRLSGRLDELGALRERWVNRHETWRSWRQALQGQDNFAELAPDIDATIERIEQLLATASDAAAEPLALQRRIEALRTAIERVGDDIDQIRAGRRRALFDRGQPMLLSSQHRAELAEEGWRGWNPLANIEPSAYVAFVRGQVGMLGFHLLLVILIGAALRRLRPMVESEKAWGGLLERPFTLGLLASVVVAMMRITLAPPLWDVLLWAFFGLAAARLAQRLFTARALRLTVYLLACFYPAFLLLEVARLPEAVFRLGLVVVAAFGIPLFVMLAQESRDAAASTGDKPERREWPLRIGAGVWVIVVLSVVLGFDALGRWMLHAAVMTAAVAFVVTIAFVFVHAAVASLSRAGEGGNLWWRAGGLLAHRVITLLRIAVVIIGTLVLLDVWGVAESPLAIWQRFTGLGFTIGSIEFTIGSILMAVLVVYLAVLLSGLLRSFLEADPAAPGAAGHPRLFPDVDRGLTQSISKLAHYALLTLGIIFGLGVMGVQLQNFAIVAGALGIGIGFGLQNVVNNFASGLILLMERPVRVGDTVIVGDVWGTIRKIGLRSTIMLTLDQSEMIVPNADLVSEKVINWTLSNPTARIILPVGVAYGSPVAEVLAILGEAAFAHDSVMKDPAPEVLFVEFGDSSLDFELRIWVQNIRLRLEVRSIVLQDIDRRFREASIEIPFPQRDLHLRSVDQVAVERLRKPD